jgi:hypothetical protein
MFEVVAVAALTLAAAPTADAATVQSFRATVSGDEVHDRVVLCANVGARIVFRTRLDAREGRTYVLPARTGRQRHVCPIWRYDVPLRFPSGDYTTQVRIAVGHERLRTRRVALVLP